MIGGTLGLLGIVGCMIYVINYINTINEFDTPMLAPYSPRISDDLKDGLHRTTIVNMKKRPYSMPSKDKIRGLEGDEK